jgi:hypothetical protein
VAFWALVTVIGAAGVVASVNNARLHARVAAEAAVLRGQAGESPRCDGPMPAELLPSVRRGRRF